MSAYEIVTDMVTRPKSIVPIIGEPDIDESYIRQQDAVQAEKLQLITNCDRSDYRSSIYTIRGVQVMLDRDLASAYHVSTTAFNQAVKRNLNRFPEGFRFQLTKEEHAILISQIVTSKRETYGKGKVTK